MHGDRYAHVIRTLSGERYADLEALITAARGTLVFRHGSASGV